MHRSITATMAMLAAIATACNNGDSGTGTNNDTTSTTVTPVAGMLTEQEQKDGWEMLFDGKSTKGWHIYGNKSNGAAWKATDGVLWLDTSNKVNRKIEGGGDLVTDNEYDNFHLKLDWKISKNGNSGIIFFVSEDTAKYKHSYETGPEMQVLDNDGHPDGKIAKHRSGDLYDLIAVSKETVHPVGEWNNVEIKSDKGKLDFWLNGEHVVSTTMWDDNWTKLIGASKFKQWPGFGTFKKGKIALQDHDNNVSFRNIKLLKLK